MDTVRIGALALGFDIEVKNPHFSADRSCVAVDLSSVVPLGVVVILALVDSTLHKNNLIHVARLQAVEFLASTTFSIDTESQPMFCAESNGVPAHILFTLKTD